MQLLLFLFEFHSVQLYAPVTKEFLHNQVILVLFFLALKSFFLTYLLVLRL